MELQRLRTPKSAVGKLRKHGTPWYSFSLCLSLRAREDPMSLPENRQRGHSPFFLFCLNPQFIRQCPLLEFALLSPWIQMLISFRNAFPDTPRIPLNPLSGHPTTQPSLHIKFTIIERDSVFHRREERMERGGRKGLLLCPQCSFCGIIHCLPGPRGTSRPCPTLPFIWLSLTPRNHLQGTVVFVS